MFCVVVILAKHIASIFSYEQAAGEGQATYFRCMNLWLGLASFILY